MLLPDWTVAPLIGAGGYLGALSRGLLSSNVGAMGCLVGGIAMTIVGMMMWTEYLIFTAGRVAFSPAMVAASAILPFGLVHGFMQWFNGEVDEEYEDEDEYEYEDEAEGLEEDEFDQRRRTSHHSASVAVKPTQKYSMKSKSVETAGLPVLWQH